VWGKRKEKRRVWTALAPSRQAQGRARRVRESLGRDLQRRELLAKADRRHEEDILRIHRVGLACGHAWRPSVCGPGGRGSVECARPAPCRGGVGWLGVRGERPGRPFFLATSVLCMLVGA